MDKYPHQLSVFFYNSFGLEEEVMLKNYKYTFIPSKVTPNFKPESNKRTNAGNEC